MENKEGQEPKKIVALKVPSLFIKAAPNTGNESGSSAKQSDGSATKKVSRPMPASARKKLEEFKKKDEEKADNGTEDSKSETSNGNESNSSNKSSTARPMPASARRKLDENKSSEPTEETGTPVIISKEVKKPMPASIKKKLEGMANTESSGSDLSTPSKDDSISEKKTGSRPMPASARRKLDESKTEEKVTGREDDNLSTTSNKGSRVSSIGSTTSSTAKVSRPMPASARKKLEMEKDSSGINENSLQADENVPKITPTQNVKSRPGPASVKRKVEESNQKEGEKGETPKKQPPMPASVRKKLEETGINSDVNVETKTATVGSGDATKPANKITISLDGIKFPKFSKPMPASAKRKVEDQETPTRRDKDDLNATEKCETSINHEQNSDKADETENTTSRTRRSGTSIKMLTSLITEKYPCQFCGKEFYTISRKNEHEKKVHTEKQESGAEAVKVPKSSSKQKAKKGNAYPDYKCPHCQKYIRDRKKLSNHVYKCGKPFAFSCQHCDKKFQFEARLSTHLKSHFKTTPAPVENQEVPQSSEKSDYGSPVPSPMSVGSNGGTSKSSKVSVVEKTKPIPKSVKAKLDLSKDNQDNLPRNKTDSTTPFKRKISEVLSNLASRNVSGGMASKNIESSEEDEEDKGPPRKKAMVSEELESIQGRPMPASVRKKLEERTQKESVSSSTNKKTSDETKEKISKNMQSVSASKGDDHTDLDVDDNECEVCHRIFTSIHNRIRHEKNVHSILEPRNKPSIKPKSSSEPTVSQSSKPEQRLDSSKTSGTDLDLLTIPAKKGRCPICKNFYTKLRQHVRKVHKVGTSDGPTTSSVNISSSTSARLSAPKSYKIYKTAAKKAKQKLTTPTSPPTSVNKSVVSLAKLSPTDVSSLEQKSTHNKVEPVRDIESHPEASVSTSTNRCTCCDKTFELQGDFHDHMEMRHPNRKRVITCKLCRHMFSHEEDFITHIQFKHKDLVSGIQPTPKAVDKSPGEGSKQKSKNHSSISTPSTSGRVTRTSALASSHPVDHQQQSSNNTTPVKEQNKKVELLPSKKVSVVISVNDRELAEKAKSTPKAESSVMTSPDYFSRTERAKRRSSFRVQTPSPEPEVMDTYDDEPDNYDDTMEVDSDPVDEIAITSTFSQRPPSPKNNALGLDEMPCSTCTEVFYSYEALRKHELYFHNTKLSKMCPICGVYPTRLHRHLLAHENKTVRCSCAPCRLSFQNFGELLKHNLEKHAGPEGGAQCAPNKPRSVANENESSTSRQEESLSEVQQENKSESIFCKICSSSFVSMRQAKQHVWRVHPEKNEDVEIYLKRSCDDGIELDVSRTDDAVVTIESDDDTFVKSTVKQPGKPAKPMPASLRSKVEQVPKPSRPMPASARAKFQKPLDVIDVSDTDTNNSDDRRKPSRPMPASVLAKLPSQKSLELEGNNSSDDNKAQDKPKPSRPMPASARAKLQESVEVDRNEDVIKPKRPMPASVKAKLQKSVGSLNQVEDGNKPKPRPMPASVRAKMNIEKISHESDSNSESNSNKPMPASARANLVQDSQSSTDPSKPRRAMPASMKAKLMGDGDGQVVKKIEPVDPEEVYDNDSTHEELEDDRDDIPSDVEQNDEDPEYIPDEIEPLPHSIPTFSIADEIAEHDNAVRMAMGGEDLLLNFKCKLCHKKMDSIESIRRHIRRDHTEYGPEHMEKLIEPLYAPASHSLRTRKSNVRYTEDDDEIDEEEEIIRPQKSKKRGQGLSVIGSSKADTPDNLAYACKFCGKRCTSSANVRRHISKSHKYVSAEDRNNGVIVFETGEVSYNTEPAWNATNDKDDAPLFSCSHCSYRSTDEDEYVRHFKTHTGESPYQCPYCSASFLRSQKLDAHVQREHSGADFSNNEEPEICLEDMTAVPQISVSVSSRIQIDQPQTVSLDRRFSNESNGHSNEKVRLAGPKSKRAATSVSDPILVSTIADDDNDDDDKDAGSSSSPSKDKDEEENSQNEPASGITYQTDLSSLFPSLREAPTGLDEMDDIEGGMSLD